MASNRQQYDADYQKRFMKFVDENTNNEFILALFRAKFDELEMSKFETFAAEYAKDKAA